MCQGFYNVNNYFFLMAELTGDLRAELLCIAGELGGKMETFTCYNANKSWKRIEIVYDEMVQDGN